MENQEAVLAVICEALPSVQAIYLFGSCSDGNERPDSDVDLAVLLPHAAAKAAGSLNFSDLRFHLQEAIGREVDLVNLRTVSIVFRHEIISTGTPVHIPDVPALEEFEMITLSLYQKLNEERAEILRSVRSDGRAYAV